MDPASSAWPCISNRTKRTRRARHPRQCSRLKVAAARVQCLAVGVDVFTRSRRNVPALTEHGSGLGRFRWVADRTHAWLHNFRRLRIRFERRADIHEAFLNAWLLLQIVISANGGHNFRQYRDLNVFAYPFALTLANRTEHRSEVVADA